MHLITSKTPKKFRLRFEIRADFFISGWKGICRFPYNSRNKYHYFGISALVPQVVGYTTEK